MGCVAHVTYLTLNLLENSAGMLMPLARSPTLSCEFRAQGG
jgi:hypothetical protein